MTNKTTMPEPVAWRSKYKDFPECDGHYIRVDLNRNPKMTGTEEIYDLEPLITTEQAEAYKDACVREALGPVIDELERICAADRAGDCESIAMDALSDIRALFPQ